MEQEESYELHVARDAFNEKHGAFLNHILEAFLLTDSENFELMRPFMRILIVKYGLKCGEKCKRDGTGWRDEVPDWAVEVPEANAGGGVSG